MALAAAHAQGRSLEAPARPLQPEVRRQRRRRTRLLTNARLFALCLIPLVALLLYVALTAGLTAQTYALGVQQQLHSQLIEKNNSLRSQVAQLVSVDRLQQVARQLHMSAPAKVAVIAVPLAFKAPSLRRTALLDNIDAVTRWLGAR